MGKIGSARYRKLENPEDQEARLFINWLEKGIFHALQRKFLEIVLIEVHSVDDKNHKKTKQLLECYSFSISYGKQGANFSLSARDATSKPLETKEQIKNTASQVLHSLVELTQTLRPLPHRHAISVKLYYTADTPANYQPPMFKATTSDAECWFEEKPLRINAGIITTCHHSLTMTLRAQASDANRHAGVLNIQNTQDSDFESQVDNQQSCHQQTQVEKQESLQTKSNVVQKQGNNKSNTKSVCFAKQRATKRKRTLEDTTTSTIGRKKRKGSVTNKSIARGTNKSLT